MCSELTKKFTDDQAYLEKEIKNSFKNVQCIELVPEHMTGKLVNESKLHRQVRGKHKPNHIVGVPSHYESLLHSKKLENKEISFFISPV